MANYLLVYHGGGMAETPEEQKRVMDAWGEWFGKLGSAVVDGGDPASQSKLVNGNGSVSDAGSNPVTGYSILQADSMDQAIQYAKDCPIMEGGNASIEVVETFKLM